MSVATSAYEDGLARVARRDVSSSRIKRAIDILGALAIIAFIAPLMLVVSLAIKLDSPGSVLFVQRRTGLNGKPFKIFKFRSMTVAEDGDKVSQATKGDMRVTRVGAFLRRSSIDELPQLFNVLRGDMSLVGPRPHALAHDEHFAGQVAHYNDRFRARPGITGLAQVRGFRGEILATNQLAERIDADNEYIETWSSAQDIAILFRTLLVAFFHRNAY